MTPAKLGIFLGRAKRSQSVREIFLGATIAWEDALKLRV